MFPGNVQPCGYRMLGVIRRLHKRLRPTLVVLMELIWLVCLIWADLTDGVDWIGLIDLTDLV